MHNTRTLLCFSFVSCGACSYGENCDYIHDDRIGNRFYHDKIKKSHFGGKDSFFWDESSDRKYYKPNKFSDSKTEKLWINFLNDAKSWEKITKVKRLRNCISDIKNATL